ncbi:MAG: SagB/ThcOx family dehydrogenase [Gemmatimonadota bacterium]|nr:SagB/ThcOx family dehydrogenase [Gemmatimonadota bacterium]
MAIKEEENALTSIGHTCDSSPSRTALDPSLLSELEKLESTEQNILTEFLKRAQRDRSVNGQMDELAFVVNGLKDFPTKDEWLNRIKLRGRIAPELHKEHVGIEKIPLSFESGHLNKPLSEVIRNRASCRDFDKSDLPFETLSSLLYQSCGVRGTFRAYNRPRVPLRYFPSGGGLQCVDVYLAVNDVEKIPQGLYRYNPILNCLEQMERGNFRQRVVDCCFMCKWMATAGAVFFIVSNLPRLAWKYGGYQSYRLAHLDVGIVSQNLHLVASALGLGSCMVFGFSDQDADILLGIDGRHEFTTLLIPVGRKLDTESFINKGIER